MLYKTRGIVLKEVKFNESDKILTILSRDSGKIQAIAKGARKPKSKIIAASQVFCHSDYVLYRGKSMYTVNQADIIDSFYSIREDFEKLIYATYIMELTDAGIVKEESNSKIFDLILKTLNVLVSSDDYMQLIRAFELKFMSFIGYRPHLKSCVNCQSKLNSNMKFSYNLGGILCSKCFTQDRYAKNIDASTLNSMVYLLFSKLDELNDRNINDKTMTNIEQIMRKYILKYIDKKDFKSLRLLGII